MTFAELTADVARMREMETTALQSYTDTEVEELKQELAKSELKQDLSFALSLDMSSEYDIGQLDTIVDKHYTLLRGALAYKQLFWVMAQSSVGDYNKDRAAFYGSRYKSLSETFRSLRSANPSSIKSISLYL